MASDVEQIADELLRLSSKVSALAARLRELAPEPEPDPAWFAIAQEDVGRVREVPGREAHPRIAEALSMTRHPSRSDETPWCSAIMCLWLAEASLPHTGSAAARSWLEYGTECELRRGAIVTLWRGSPDSSSGHVGLALSWDKDNVTLIGGNQGNSVSSKEYPRSRILRVCWPEPE